MFDFEEQMLAVCNNPLADWMENKLGTQEPIASKCKLGSPKNRSSYGDNV
jgi:hypothetical protein